MPAYELSLLLKVLPRAETSVALKRIGTVLLDKGASIQKLENLGQKDLPYKMTKEGVHFTKGQYFVYTFLSSPKIFSDVNDICKRDLDFLRCGIADVYKDLSSKCTLDEEFNPPAYRKSVKKLMDDGKKYRNARRISYKCERDYSYFDIYM